MRNSYYSRLQQIRKFNDLRFVSNKKKQTSDLLQFLLPKRAFERWKQNKLTNDKYESATLLFADIAGFTKYSSTKHPNEVVKTLRQLFTEFDKLCQKYDVYKVYTIGDCYVVLGIQDENNRNYAMEAKNVIDVAFEMIDVIRAVRQEIDFHDLDMRIGIHTGTIIGGIVGSFIVRYDLYGLDVSMANKMESSGQTGKVNISETTRNLLEENYPGVFTYTNNQTVTILDTSMESFFTEYKQFSNEISEEEEEQEQEDDSQNI